MNFKVLVPFLCWERVYIYNPGRTFWSVLKLSICQVPTLYRKLRCRPFAWPFRQKFFWFSTGSSILLFSISVSSFLEGWLQPAGGSMLFLLQNCTILTGVHTASWVCCNTMLHIISLCLFVWGIPSMGYGLHLHGDGTFWHLNFMFCFDQSNELLKPLLVVKQTRK